MNTRKLMWLILALWAMLVPALAQEAPPPVPHVDTERKTVTVPAVLHLAAFEASDPPGHHLLTWARGRAGKKALLRTPVSDAAVLDALERLGGTPGDNLTAEAWTERADPEAAAPDVRAKGSRLEVTAILPSGERVPVATLVEDVHAKGTEWVLAGNRALIPKWRSGCVICLQSCPGSKVANAKATMRDLHRGRAHFRPSKKARDLGEGAQVKVELRLLVEEEEKKRREEKN